MNATLLGYPKLARQLLSLVGLALAGIALASIYAYGPGQPAAAHELHRYANERLQQMRASSMACMQLGIDIAAAAENVGLSDGETPTQALARLDRQAASTGCPPPPASKT